MNAIDILLIHSLGLFQIVNVSEIMCEIIMCESQPGSHDMNGCCCLFRANGIIDQY